MRGKKVWRENKQIVRQREKKMFALLMAKMKFSFHLMWDSNPRQQRYTDPGPLKDALLAELARHNNFST